MALKRNTAIKRTRFFTFPINRKISYTIAEATTTNGVKLLAITRKSALDKDDPKMAQRVLNGKINKVLRLYRAGKRIKGNVHLSAMVPKRAVKAE